MAVTLRDSVFNCIALKLLECMNKIILYDNVLIL